MATVNRIKKFIKTPVVPLWATFGKFGRLFIPTFGHTERCHHASRKKLCTNKKFTDKLDTTKLLTDNLLLNWAVPDVSHIFLYFLLQLTEKTFANGFIRTSADL